MDNSVTNSNRLMICLGIVAFIALLFCTVDIHNRPLHGDEGVNTIKFKILYGYGTFHYNPHEYHGPSLYYLSYPVMLANGLPSYAESTVGMYRFVPAFFLVGTIALLWFIRDGLGKDATVAAGLVTAFSPVFIFYGRYYIHEWLLVFFSMVMLVGIWRYLNNRTWQNAALIGVGLGMMHTTKETCIIAWFAMTIGCIYWWFVTRKENDEQIVRFTCTPIHAAVITLVAVVLSVLFFSAFFTYPDGVLDSILTYKQYFVRAGGEGSYGLHDQPWYYYLRMLAFSKAGPGPWFSEAPLLLFAVIGGIAPWISKWPLDGNRVWLRFLSIYTLIMVMVYSLIAYKTPWCILGMVHGMTLLAGVGVYALWQAGKNTHVRMMVRVCVVLLIGFLGWQVYHANFKFPVDRRNPYLYSNPQRSMLEIPKRAETIASLHPEKMDMAVSLIGSDNWPLPFYLRAFPKLKHVIDPTPELLSAPLIIVDPDPDEKQLTDPDFFERISTELSEKYHLEMKALRPRERRAIFIRKDLWDGFMKRQK